MALAEQANPALAAEAVVRVPAADSRSGCGRQTQLLFVAADLIVIWLSSLAALALRFTPAFSSRFGLTALNNRAHLIGGYAGFLLLYSALVVLLCHAQGLYTILPTLSPGEERLAIGKGIALATILQAGCIGFSEFRLVSHFVIGFTVAMSAVLLAGWRGLRQTRLQKACADGLSCRNVLIVGTGLQALALRAYLGRNRHLGYVVRGLVACGANDGEAESVDVLGSIGGLRALARDVELRPGDTVIVPKAGIVYVLGDVGRPGGYVMQNSGKISLLEAVALAQGLNRTAAKKHTRLIRKNASGVQETVLDLKHVLEGKLPDPELQPEDIVYIPPSTPKSLLTHTPALVQSATSAVVYQAVP